MAIYSQYPHQFLRYPLVYLVEAADDICYQIMDIEDACKLHILTTEEAIQLLLGFFEGERLEHIRKVMHMVDDTNEQIAYLRSCIIGLLVDECSRVFLENEESILNGTYSTPLISNICDQLSHIRAGKANPKILDCVKVMYYGAPVPLTNVATVTVPDARTIMITPWEKKIIRDIEKGILDSELGITPENNGEVIRLGIPPLTEERRRQLICIITFCNKNSLIEF